MSLDFYDLVFHHSLEADKHTSIQAEGERCSDLLCEVPREEVPPPNAFRGNRWRSSVSTFLAFVSGIEEYMSRDATTVSILRWKLVNKRRAACICP